MTATEKKLREVLSDVAERLSFVHSHKDDLCGGALCLTISQIECVLSMPPEPEAGKDDGCICRGNWREIVREYRHLYDKKFVRDGKEYVFAGVVDASDDYYYLMVGTDGKIILGSCVGALEKEVGHGFTLAPSPALPTDEKKKCVGYFRNGAEFCTVHNQPYRHCPPLRRRKGERK